MSNELSTTKEKVDNLKALFEKFRPNIAGVLPKHLMPDRIIKIALGCITRTPLLLQCSASSVLQSVLVASQLGLEAGGALGSAYLVPFRNRRTGQYEATLIIGYRGLIDLARRSEHVTNIHAHVVYKADKFKYTEGTTTLIEHEPALLPDVERGDIQAVYAVAHLRDGSPQVEVMTKDDVDKIRGRSRAADDGPWVTDYAEMAKKTVVKRLVKYLPLSVEHEGDRNFATAIEADSRMDVGEGVSDLIDMPEIENGNGKTETRTEQIKDKLKSARKGAKETVAEEAPEETEEQRENEPESAPEETNRQGDDQEAARLDLIAAIEGELKEKTKYTQISVALAEIGRASCRERV